MTFEYYNTQPKGLLSLAAMAQEGWRWRYRASNGKIVSSGESYVSKADCLHAIQLMMDTTRQTPVVETAS